MAEKETKRNVAQEDTLAEVIDVVEDNMERENS